MRLIVALLARRLQGAEESEFGVQPLNCEYPELLGGRGGERGQPSENCGGTYSARALAGSGTQEVHELLVGKLTGECTHVFDHVGSESVVAWWPVARRGPLRHVGACVSHVRRC